MATPSDFSRDELRRQVRQSQADHGQLMTSMRDLVGRLVEGDHRHPPGATSAFLSGGLNRRRFLRIGGVTLLSSAVVAACGKTAGVNGPPPTTTPTTANPSTGDIAVLRLASSLEHYAVGLYMTAIGSGLLKTATIADAARYFADQHSDHARADEQFTANAGGQPFTTANPVVAASLKPRVDGLVTEADVVKLAYDVERVAAATYFASIGVFHDTKLNAPAASIMGIEARHVGVWGMILSGLPAPLPTVPARTDSPPYTTAGFQTGDGAVAAGTGV